MYGCSPLPGYWRWAAINRIYEQPPILRGTADQQIRQLRDYLARMYGSLSRAETAPVSTAVGQLQSGSGGGISRSGAVDKQTVEMIRANAARLKALIIKTAEELDTKIQGIDGTYFYIRYAPVENPTAEQMTAKPTEDTVYMGVCSTSSDTAPTDPAAYNWSRVKGNAGENALTLQIVSSNGNIFQNGKISTVLSARVYSGSVNVTDSYDPNAFIWTRVSEDSEADELWNSAHCGGTKSIEITDGDVVRRATFFCDLIDTTTRFSLLI